MFKLAVTLTTLVLAVVLGPAAQAAPPYEKYEFSVSESGTFEDCGMTIAFDTESSGRGQLRTAKGSDGQAFLEHVTFRFRDTYTNVETGRTMVFTGNGLYHDLTATHVSGDVYEFTAHQTGRPLLITDLEGNRLAFERGRVFMTVLFDTLGDSAPGGVFLSEEEPVFHGQFETGDLGFCDFAEMFIG